MFQGIVLLDQGLHFDKPSLVHFLSYTWDRALVHATFLEEVYHLVLGFLHMDMLPMKEHVIEMIVLG